MSCKWKDICPLRRLELENKIDNVWQEKYCNTKENWKDCQRYQMEEKGLEHSDNLLPNGSLLK